MSMTGPPGGPRARTTVGSSSHLTSLTGQQGIIREVGHGRAVTTLLIAGYGRVPMTMTTAPAGRTAVRSAGNLLRQQITSGRGALPHHPDPGTRVGHSLGAGWSTACCRAIRRPALTGQAHPVRGTQLAACRGRTRAGKVLATWGLRSHPGCVFPMRRYGDCNPAPRLLSCEHACPS